LLLLYELGVHQAARRPKAYAEIRDADHIGKIVVKMI